VDLVRAFCLSSPFTRQRTLADPTLDGVDRGHAEGVAEFIEAAAPTDEVTARRARPGGA
jgi:hypothetical protein